MKLPVPVRKWQELHRSESGGGERETERQAGEVERRGRQRERERERDRERESDGTTEQHSEVQGRGRERESDREREGKKKRELQGDLAGSVCLCLSSNGSDVHNMQRGAVIIICAPHRRGPPCALEDGAAPRGAARSAEPVVKPTRDS